METSFDGNKIARHDPKSGRKDLLLLPELNQAVTVMQKDPNNDIVGDTNIPERVIVSPLKEVRVRILIPMKIWWTTTKKTKKTKKTTKRSKKNLHEWKQMHERLWKKKRNLTLPKKTTNLVVRNKVFCLFRIDYDILAKRGA